MGAGASLSAMREGVAARGPAVAAALTGAAAAPTNAPTGAAAAAAPNAAAPIAVAATAAAASGLSSAVQRRPALALGHLLGIFQDVLLGVEVGRDLRQPLWLHLAHHAHELLGGQHQLLVHHPLDRHLHATWG
jgi:hypothetical protein